MNRCFERELQQFDLLQDCVPPYTHRRQPHVCLDLILRRLDDHAERQLARQLHRRYAYRARCRQYERLAQAIIRGLVAEAELEGGILHATRRHLLHWQRRQRPIGRAFVDFYPEEAG